MAIIYTYPTATPQASDILIGTDKDATLRNPTKNFLISDIADYIINTFSGTSLSVPIFLDETRPDGSIVTTLTDSIMAQDASPAGTTLTITGNISVTGTYTDSAGSTGTATQQLTSTGAATAWNDQTGQFPNVSALVWTVNHAGTWGPYPSVTVINNNDIVMFGEVEYISTTQLTITFSATFAGTAYLN
jgi:hypothetical protein